jgi:hypothetical protein
LFDDPSQPGLEFRIAAAPFDSLDEGLLDGLVQAPAFGSGQCLSVGG